MVDYFSQYLEVKKLNTTTVSIVIEALKEIFTRFGIPSVVVSDNGHQYDSREMKEFAH